MADHPNARGYKPQIRVYIPHQKEYCKIKLAQLGKLALLKLKANEMGCPDSDMWYVDTAGCAMLQADDANPPPRHGFVRRAMQYAAVLLLGLMMLVGSASCKKDPQPAPAPNPVPTDTVTPITPTDTITPIVPGDTITPTPGDTIVPEPPVPGGDTIVPEPPMPMDTVKFSIKINNENGYEILYPSVDTVKKYKDKVVILKWRIPPNMTKGWTPDAFHSPRNNLKPLFALPQEIFGQGTIFVNKNYGGASIPCADSLNISILGMTECDKEIFTGWGFEVNDEYAKSQREKHFQMLDTIGMSRAILGKQR